MCVRPRPAIDKEADIQRVYQEETARMCSSIATSILCSSLPWDIDMSAFALTMEADRDESIASGRLAADEILSFTSDEGTKFKRRLPVPQPMGLAYLCRLGVQKSGLS